MNENANATSLSLNNDIVSINWMYWARRLLVCNPFFLCSAALFLFGINRLSLDPKFLGSETANLIFNFSALQGYELLVVATALLLARRKTWYDSALLIVIDCGLTLVPFFLISHGVVTSRGLGLAFAAFALLAAAARFCSVRRWFPTFNLPRPLLATGACIVMLNACLPFAFWPWARSDMDRWLFPNQILWLAALPIIALGANMLPAPQSYGGTPQQRHWLPLFIYALWTAGTGAHIWCVGYLCDIQLRPHFLAPVALVAAWTVRRRIAHFSERPTKVLKLALLGAPFFTPLLAAAQPILLETLLAVNIALYAFCFQKCTGLERKVAGILMFSTIAVMVAGLPLSLLPSHLGRISRAHLIGGVTVLCACALAFRSAHPALGVAASTTIFTALNVANLGLPAFVPVHAAAMFLLLHSLAWRVSFPALTAIRVTAAMIWILNASMWIHDGSLPVNLCITTEGLLVVMAAAGARLYSGAWRSPVVPLAGIAVVLTVPGDFLIHQGSPGLIALVTSTFFFAVGTVVAWTRHRTT